MKYFKQSNRMAVYLALMSLLLTQVSCSSSQHIALAAGQHMDPTCGIVVNEHTAISYSYQGTIYYFDTEECLSVFKKNPNKFIKDSRGNWNVNASHMGWWLPATGGYNGGWDDSGYDSWIKSLKQT